MAAVTAIYAPIVRDTFISFEVVPPTADEMSTRIASTLERLPWLVGVDSLGRINGYAYASRHRERTAYQWSVDVSAYVRDDARGLGVGRQLYDALLAELAGLGYVQAFAGIALPNRASVGLHESMGFRQIGTFRRVGFKLGAWRDVGWWQKEIGAPDAGPLPPRPYAAGVRAT